jgi:hypothetical protein
MHAANILKCTLIVVYSKLAFVKDDTPWVHVTCQCSNEINFYCLETWYTKSANLYYRTDSQILTQIQMFVIWEQKILNVFIWYGSKHMLLVAYWKNVNTLPDWTNPLLQECNTQLVKLKYSDSRLAKNWKYLHHCGMETLWQNLQHIHSSYQLPKWYNSTDICLSQYFLGLIVIFSTRLFIKWPSHLITPHYGTSRFARWLYRLLRT